MTLQHLEAIIIEAYVSLSIVGLNQLDEESLYSGLDKEQIIAEIHREIKTIRNKGLRALNYKPTTCNFCYPTATAFDFLDKNTDELILRYVIHEENPFEYIVEICKNRALPDGENGLPF